MVTMMGRDNNLCGLSVCEVSLGVFHLRPFLEFLFFPLFLPVYTAVPGPQAHCQ